MTIDVIQVVTQGPQGPPGQDGAAGNIGIDVSLGDGVVTTGSRNLTEFSSFEDALGTVIGDAAARGGGTVLIKRSQAPYEMDHAVGSVAEYTASNVRLLFETGAVVRIKQTSVTPSCFSIVGDGVTVENLVIEDETVTTGRGSAATGGGQDVVYLGGHDCAFIRCKYTALAEQDWNDTTHVFGIRGDITGAPANPRNPQFIGCTVIPRIGIIPWHLVGTRGGRIESNYCGLDGTEVGFNRRGARAIFAFNDALDYQVLNNIYTGIGIPAGAAGYPELDPGDPAFDPILDLQDNEIQHNGGAAGAPVIGFGRVRNVGQATPSGGRFSGDRVSQWYGGGLGFYGGSVFQVDNMTTRSWETWSEADIGAMVDLRPDTDGTYIEEFKMYDCSMFDSLPQAMIARNWGCNGFHMKGCRTRNTNGGAVLEIGLDPGPPGDNIPTRMTVEDCVFQASSAGRVFSNSITNARRWTFRNIIAEGFGIDWWNLVPSDGGDGAEYVGPLNGKGEEAGCEWYEGQATVGP